MKTVRWSAFELAALYAAARREMAAKATAHFVGRSLDAVYSKTREQGIAIRTNPRWTTHDIAVLRESKTLDEVVQRTGRTESAVFNKSKRLNIKLDCREFFKRRNKLLG